MMIIKKITFFLNKGGNRASLVKKNILATFFIKGLSILVSLLYVPLTLNYLNPTRYGIWLTLTSIVAWMSIFDVGLGNGLRNKLAEALALNDKVKAKKYVSTTYAMLSIIVALILIFFIIANHWINWSIALNTTAAYGVELKNLALIVVVLFGARFVLGNISTVFLADQRPAIGSIFEVIGNAIGLFIIWILTITNKTSLITFGFAAMLTPVIVLLGASIFYYNNKYAYLRPSWSSIDLSHAKDLMGLGLKFFIIQIAVLVIFQTSNILIAQFFSPAEVTPYNITFKYYGVLTMIWGILIMPLWSAFTHAFSVNDFDWINRTMSKLNRLFIIVILLIIIMSFSANFIINLWTNGKVIVDQKMIWIFAIYTFVSLWSNLYALFLNSISQTKIQIITSLIGSAINIPLAFIFVKGIKMGSEGVVLAMCISLSFFAISGPIQTYKIMREKSSNPVKFI